MRRIGTIMKLSEEGVVAVIRAESKEKGLKIVEAPKKRWNRNA